MQDLKNQKFNHFKIHTQYSICEGALKIENLKDFCKENKLQSIGISDTSNLCGALEFAENISKVGTKPIISGRPPLQFRKLDMDLIIFSYFYAYFDSYTSPPYLFPVLSILIIFYQYISGILLFI